ncbi:hypothetical protein AQ486_05635 [Enterococcus faecalis]|nr:hypothetical protein AQ486_05635 [Enterococcus faecalis]
MEKTDLPEIYDRTLKTFKKFLPQIENALRYGYSNGPLECLNNHIKVLKHEMPMVFEAFTTLNYES